MNRIGTRVIRQDSRPEWRLNVLKVHANDCFCDGPASCKIRYLFDAAEWTDTLSGIASPVDPK